MVEREKSEYIRPSGIEGLMVIERPIFWDERGFFHEIFRVNGLLASRGIDFKMVQMSHSMSEPKVIRAIHTEDWNKLVYPVTGVCFVAIVDMRPESLTFGKHEEFIFDNTREDSPHMALFLPRGMGNSICVIGEERVHYIYAVDDYWDNARAQGVAWDDPDLAINWPIKDPIISERDRNNPTMRELFPDKF